MISGALMPSKTVGLYGFPTTSNVVFGVVVPTPTWAIAKEAQKKKPQTKIRITVFISFISALIKIFKQCNIILPVVNVIKNHYHFTKLVNGLEIMMI